MPKGKLGRGMGFVGEGSFLLHANHVKDTAECDHNELRITKRGQWWRKLRALCRFFVPMTRIRVLAVMLVTTLVATHSHSPWSSLLRDRNCKLPLGRMLCLLLLGFPTFNGHENHSDMVKKSWPITFQYTTGKNQKHTRWFAVLCVCLLHLSPGDGWYIRVSRSSTGDY